MNHTPGPWVKTRRCSTLIEGSSGRHVCTTGGYSDNRLEDGGLTENEANADLISAAPELYDALYNCLSLVKTAFRDTDGPANVAIDEAQQAMTKAEGEQS